MSVGRLPRVTVAVGVDSKSPAAVRIGPDHTRLQTVLDSAREARGEQPAVIIKNLVKRYGNLLAASFYPNPLAPREVLDSPGIEHLARIAFQNLSGGQKQRVSIALALVGNPQDRPSPRSSRSAWLLSPWFGRGAAVRALLFSLFGEAPPVPIFVALVCYTLGFAFVAVRYFRWE